MKQEKKKKKMKQEEKKEKTHDQTIRIARTWCSTYSCINCCSSSISLASLSASPSHRTSLPSQPPAALTRRCSEEEKNKEGAKGQT